MCFVAGLLLIGGKFMRCIGHHFFPIFVQVHNQEAGTEFLSLAQCLSGTVRYMWMWVRARAVSKRIALVFHIFLLL